MTRESLPRFDLYGELEVSPFASVGTIEAAYRSLVKQHHPDVSSGNEARMRRLNLAREWLTDGDLRRRYDRETDRGRSVPAARSAVTHSVVTRSNVDRRSKVGTAARSTPGPSGPTSPADPSFGIHADEVRQFLAELRSLDRPRAQRVWNGRAVAHTKGYTQALRAAASAARGERHAEWQFAREAAAVIARGKLGDSTLADQVADVLSDVAGAIAIRDLLSPSEFSLVLLPWTWRGTVKLPEVQAASESAAARPPAPVPAPAPRAVPPAESLAPSKPSQPSERRRAPAPPPALASATTPVAIATTAGPTISAAHPTAPGAMTDLKPERSAIAQSIAAARNTAAPPFVAAAPPPRQPPSWPTSPPEPHARPPLDSTIDARLAAASAPAPMPSAAAIRTRPTPIRAAVYAPPQRRGIGLFPVALAAASLVLLLGAAILMLPAARPDQAIAGLTDAPTGTVALGGAPETSVPSTGAAQTEAPTPSSGPTTGGGGSRATPKPTIRAAATPKPTKRPSATPSPTTQPTPTPTPVSPTAPPASTCQVPNLVGQNTGNLPALWTGAGFTGTVTYTPSVPPQYKVLWQSLPADSFAPCTSGIEVRKTP